MTQDAELETCPICQRPAVRALRPFCSKRCADIDLGKWLKGSYAIPGPPASPADLDQRYREGRDDGADQDN